ncbi:CooT family nickel-binding protein [Thermodesulfobacteriota bacterium]
MCESTAYIYKDGEETVLLDAVDLLEDKDGEIKVRNLFGEEKKVKGKIKSLSLVDHKIMIELS